jgi:hypothetical protein
MASASRRARDHRRAGWSALRRSDRLVMDMDELNQNETEVDVHEQILVCRGMRSLVHIWHIIDGQGPKDPRNGTGRRNRERHWDLGVPAEHHAGAIPLSHGTDPQCVVRPRFDKERRDIRTDELRIDPPVGTREARIARGLADSSLRAACCSTLATSDGERRNPCSSRNTPGRGSAVTSLRSRAPSADIGPLYGTRRHVCCRNTSPQACRDHGAGRGARDDRRRAGIPTGGLSDPNKHAGMKTPHRPRRRPRARGRSVDPKSPVAPDSFTGDPSTVGYCTAQPAPRCPHSPSARAVCRSVRSGVPTGPVLVPRSSVLCPGMGPKAL